MVPLGQRFGMSFVFIIISVFTLAGAVAAMTMRNLVHWVRAGFGLCRRGGDSDCVCDSAYAGK
jgi:hypothetical protein